MRVSKLAVLYCLQYKVNFALLYSHFTLILLYNYIDIYIYNHLTLGCSPFVKYVYVETVHFIIGSPNILRSDHPLRSLSYTVSK